jgi:hypothetical protein
MREDESFTIDVGPFPLAPLVYSLVKEFVTLDERAAHAFLENLPQRPAVAKPALKRA